MEVQAFAPGPAPGPAAGAAWAGSGHVVFPEYEATVQRWVAELAGIPGVTVERGYPSEAGQPHSRAIVRLAPPCPLTRDDLVAALWEGEPRVAVGLVDDDAIALNPQTLEPGEDVQVLAALERALERAR